MATRKTSPRSRARALSALTLAHCAAAAALFAGEPAAESRPLDGCSGRYGWPVRPFDEAHPIRGNFGDPRTVFAGPRSEATVVDGDGTFSFHQGVDISAPDGSPVYSVSSGRIVRAHGGRVTVDCGNGRSFQYWHVEPAARVGGRAAPGRTLLGYIQPKREHVHLTQLENGRVVNPVAPGGLTPYRDGTAPRIVAVRVGGSTDPGVVRGRVRLVAEVVDTPALEVPGRWNGFPVTPAVVSWRIETQAGRVVASGKAPRDVRSTVPRNDFFWTTFARGTHQNWPVFDGRKAQGMTGRYLFRLSARPYDTRALRNGAYVLVVTAGDTAGNRAAGRTAFTVANGL